MRFLNVGLPRRQCATQIFLTLIGGLLLAACTIGSNTVSPLPATSQPYTEQTEMINPPQPTSGVANADVQYVHARQQTDGTWTFDVTVAHPDTGWEDYADGWDVLLPDGTVVKPDPDSPYTRLLLHPHEAEQPFTRSQSGIVIPAGVTQVTVRAHDLVDGFGGREVTVYLTVASGADFEVQTASEGED